MLDSAVNTPVHGSDVEDRWLGRRIRDLRLARGFSIKKLAGRAELSAGSISQLERGIGSPSIRSLRNISGALEVPIGFFFKDENRDDAESEYVRRLNRRKTLGFGSTGTSKDVLSVRAAKALELLVVNVVPGGSSGPDAYSHDGEEVGVVLSGVLDLWIADEHFVLQPGDSFGFKSSLPHRFGNSGSEPVQVIWVNTPPLY